jgi:hypothetical protein
MIVPVIIDQDDGLSIDVVDVFWILPFQLLGHMGQSLDHICYVWVRQHAFQRWANVWLTVLADSEALAFITVVHVNPVVMISGLDSGHSAP